MVEKQLFVMCTLINGLRYIGRMAITHFNGWVQENVKRVKLLDPMRYIEMPMQGANPAEARVQLLVLPLYAAVPLIGITCIEPISIENLSDLDAVEDSLDTYTCQDKGARPLYEQYQRSIVEIRARSAGIVEPSARDVANIHRLGTPLGSRGAPKNVG